MLVLLFLEEERISKVMQRGITGELLRLRSYNN